MSDGEITHRLAEDGALALCGEDATCVSPLDSAVTCPTCRALIALQARRREPAAPGPASPSP